eukprot:CAMPEP_0177778372 /NCGR_PEP_ID=MMETSP0491_2-20121128/15913_1 /TAXON_ID=63592 /ORGANISM="Tetraselmis chuii, Strain PLY429" /LENGTH=313 /DNA_ID=CAMNT_0019297629 /DNA_START=67 /DNA_END=1008 /DNA_ORIENTATION=-
MDDTVPSEKVASLLESGRAAEAASLLEDHLAEVGRDGSAATRAALFSELGAVRMEMGQTSEAEALFRKAVAITQVRPNSAVDTVGTDAVKDGERKGEEGEEVEDDDWENEWEDSLSQLKLSDAPATSRKSTDRATAATVAKVRAGDTARSGCDKEVKEATVTSARIFNHVVEIYNLPAGAAISELEQFVEQFGDKTATGRPVVRMVDDHHALGIFCTPQQAYRALAMGKEAGLSVRSFSEASVAAKRVPDSELQPPKARPKTTSAVARRLLGSALGMNLRDKAADKELAEQRRSKKKSAQQRREAQASVWGDD